MTNRYDLIARIFWFATGTPSAPISPERLNPLIEQLADKLQKYVFYGRTITARLIDLDEPFNSGFTPLECRGGWTLVRFDVIDASSDDGIRSRNYNDYIRGAITRDLWKIKLSHYKTTLKIINAVFP